MKRILTRILCMIGINAIGQGIQSVSIGYTNNTIVGGQIEMNMKFDLFKSVFFMPSLASNLDDNVSIKVGVGVEVFNNSKVAIFAGLRSVYENFNEEFSGASQIAYNMELPVEVNFQINKRVYTYASVLPTYNTYAFKGDKILVNWSLGIGFSFGEIE
jgi:hypothetical protein